MTRFSIVLISLFLAFPSAGQDLTALTFNIRYGTAKDEGNLWPDRKDAVVEVIRATQPDIVGIQESLSFQNEYLIDQLPEFASVGEGREGGNEGEYAAILYRESRYSLARAGRFWLSDTPEVVGSMTWADLPRIVTWADLVERGNARRLIVLNTHFAHNSEDARQKSAELIVRRLAEIVPDQVDSLLLGDFNCSPGSVAHTTILDSGFLDPLTVLGVPPTPSFHGWKGLVGEGGPIDWVLYRGRLEPTSYKVLNEKYLDRYPSDHFPVVTRFKLLPD